MDGSISEALLVKEFAATVGHAQPSSPSPQDNAPKRTQSGEVSPLPNFTTTGPSLMPPSPSPMGRGPCLGADPAEARCPGTQRTSVQGAQQTHLRIHPSESQPLIRSHEYLLRFLWKHQQSVYSSWRVLLHPLLSAPAPKPSPPVPSLPGPPRPLSSLLLLPALYRAAQDSPSGLFHLSPFSSRSHTIWDPAHKSLERWGTGGVAHTISFSLPKRLLRRRKVPCSWETHLLLPLLASVPREGVRACERAGRLLLGSRGPKVAAGWASSHHNLWSLALGRVLSWESLP